MSRLQIRQVFSHLTLARLAYDEPVMVTDHDTNIELHYRFEELAGGRLQLTGGLLRDQIISVGCEPDDINTIATIMLDGLRVQLG